MPTPLDRARRWILAVRYLLFGAAGAIAAVSTPPSFAATGVTAGLLWSWIGCLIIGGTSGAVGVAFLSPTAEQTGLIALGFGLAAYAGALLYLPHRTSGTWLIVSLILAVILGLVARYLEILRASRIGRTRP